MTLRAGLVGCGALRTLHAQMVQQLDGMPMVAFCDLDIDRAQQLCDAVGGEYATNDVERIFSDRSVQVIYVCTHHDTQAEYCIRAARAGKHTMVEKPLALTASDSLEIAAAVEENGVKLMTAFKMRYFDMILKVKELMGYGRTIPSVVAAMC